MFEIPGNTVGRSSFELIPDELIGIELRGVTRETVSMEPGMILKKAAYRRALVHRTAVPQEDNGTLKVPQ